MAIEVGPETPSGTEMFKEAWAVLGEGQNLDGIRGSWGTSMPDNLESFNAGLQNFLSPEDAALGTWTGRMAQSVGFKTATIEATRGPLGENIWAQVLFTK